MFYDRLKYACKNANMTVTATLKAIDIGTANGTYWKNGSVPSSDVVVKLAEFLNVSTDYLLLGKEEAEIITPDVKELILAYNSVDAIAKAMIKERALTLAELAAEREAKERVAEQPQKAIRISAPVTDEQPNDEQEEPETCDITYFDYPASAGTGLFLDETITEKLTVKASSEALNADYAIPISGDSIEPDFSSGDIVLIESCKTISKGEIGIFVLDGEVYIKEYGGDRLISHNSEYPLIMLKKYRTSICLGRVLGKAEIIE